MNQENLSKIEILLNGKKTYLDRDTTIVILLKELNIKNKTFAIELNNKVVPKSLYTKTFLKGKDKVEIVDFIGGG